MPQSNHDGWAVSLFEAAQLMRANESLQCFDEWKDQFDRPTPRRHILALEGGSGYGKSLAWQAIPRKIPLEARLPDARAPSPRWPPHRLLLAPDDFSCSRGPSGAASGTTS